MSKASKLADLVAQHETFWGALGSRYTASQWPELAEFLRSIWDAYLMSWEEMNRDEAATRLSRVRIAASNLGVPVPDIGSSGPRSLVSGRGIPHTFRSMCSATWTDDGKILVSCLLPDGREFSRTIDLDPIADRIKLLIRNYHDQVLHGDMSEDTVSGVGQWYHEAVNSARRVAIAKGVKELYMQVGSLWGDISSAVSDAGSFINDNRKEFSAVATAINPAAGAALATGFKVYDVVQKADKGDPKAINTLKTVKAAAQAGDPKAQQSMKTAQNLYAAMQEKKKMSYYDEGLSINVGLTYDQMMQQRQQMIDAASRQSANQRGVSSDKRGVYGQNSYKPPRKAPMKGRSADGSYTHNLKTDRALHGDSRSALPDEYEGTELLKARQRSAEAQQAIADQQAQDQDQGYDDQGYNDPGDYYQAQDPGYGYGYDSGYSGYGDSFSGNPWYSIEDGYHYETSGWLYNTPYRSASQALVQVDKSPGVGLGLRELYNLGMGRAKTTKETILLAASPTAAKIYNTVKKMGADHPTAMEYVKKGLAYLQGAY